MSEPYTPTFNSADITEKTKHPTKPNNERPDPPHQAITHQQSNRLNQATTPEHDMPSFDLLSQPFNDVN